MIKAFDGPRADLVKRVVEDAFDGRPVSDPGEIGELFEIRCFTRESAVMIAAARRLSEMACGGRAEIHAQTALNIGPCPRECLFCAFARGNGVFTEEKEFPRDYILDTCL